MLMALAAVAVVFTNWTGGTFVDPRNIFNIAVQTVPVATMACGMVFVIVARHIDLSVRSMLAMCSAVMAMSQATWLPNLFGTEFGNPLIPALTVLIGFASGTLMGPATGWLVGGTEGVLGATASWVLGAVAAAVAVWGFPNDQDRHPRQSFGAIDPRAVRQAQARHQELTDQKSREPRRAKRRTIHGRT